MTLAGKFCAVLKNSNTSWQKSRFLVLFLGLTLSACASTKQATVTRDQSQKDEIKNLVQAARLVECKLSPAEWVIPGDVGQAQLIKPEGQWALIYEALLRSGPRTVYQPLQANFSFNGDGVAMGLRGAPKVSDLRTFEDASRNRWYVSRVKRGDSELFSGLVEVIVKGKNNRTLLPLPQGESVQQIWASLPAVSGFANIIVRSTSADDSGSAQEDDSTYRWFQVGLTENSAKLITIYKAKGESIQPAAFVSLERTTEPVAVTLVQPKLESADADPKATGDGIFKVSLRRIFSRGTPERVIFSGKGNISSLSVSDSTFSPAIHLAWLFAPVKSGSRYLQTISLPVRFVPERYFAKGPLRELENILATELAYEANSPDFSFNLNNKNEMIPILSWWGKLENDVVLLVQVITPQFKQIRGQLIKSDDGASIGTVFKPSMAVIPPREFNRVMSFTAAPTQAEKSIVILSNRSESAEIAKESNLYSCLF
jgi:hypothetical protein